MADIRSVERVLATLEPTETVVDAHDHAGEIKALLTDWCLSKESERCTFKDLCTQIVDRYAQAGELGPNPEQSLKYYRDHHLAEKLILGQAWMMRGLMDGKHDLNPARQHLETAAAAQKALNAIDPAVDPSGYASMLRVKTDALKAYQEIMTQLGMIENNDVKKSLTLHQHNVSVDRDAATSVMKRTMRRARLIDVVPKPERPANE